MASILKSTADGRPNTPAPVAVGDGSSRATTMRTGVVGRLTGGVEGLSGFNLDDFAQQNKDRIEQCRGLIEKMLAEAREQAAAIHAEAESRGYAEGLERANQDVAAKVDQLAQAKAAAQLQTLQRAVVQTHSHYEAWMNQYAEVLIATALAATERIVGSKLNELPITASARPVSGRGVGGEGPTPEPPNAPEPARMSAQASEPLVVRWARQALHSTRSASRLTLFVHPDTLAEIGGELDRLLADPNLPEQSTVVPDETLEPGDVVVRQDGGEIQAGLRAQLDRLAEELAS